MNNQLFYLSPTKGHDCIKLPKKDSKYLLIDNYLSEFYTDEDKEKVLSNLGILLRLEALKNLIDLKVIEFGGVAWDLVPTEGNTDHVLSSDALYNLLSRYYTQEEIDTKIEQLFSIFVRDFKVTTDDSLSDTSENPVLNKVIKQALDELNDVYNRLSSSKADKELLSNYNTIEETSELLNQLKRELTLSQNELIAEVNESIENINNFLGRITTPEDINKSIVDYLLELKLKIDSFKPLLSLNVLDTVNNYLLFYGEN